MKRRWILMNSPKKTWFAFPYILWIIGFTLIPLGLVLYYAFTGADSGFTLANVLAITEPVHLKSLWTSLKMAFLTTLICLILAYPLGLVLCSLNLKKSNFIIFLFILPMWMNFLLRTMAWQLILSNNGVLNTLLGFLHLPKVHIIYTFQAVLIGMVYDFLPFMILPIYNSLSSIGNDVVEAGKDLGAGYFTILRKIIFPLSLPGVISGITMVFVPSMTSFVISNILGGSNTLLIGNIIEQEFTYNFNWNLGSGLSFVLLVFTLISMGLMSVFDKSEGGTNIWYMAFIFLLLYLPIIVLVVLSFNKSKARVAWRGFTFQWYANLFDNSRITDAFTTTLTLAFGSALSATIIGVVGAIGISAMKKRNYSIMLGATNIPMLNAEIVTALSLTLLFIRFIKLGFTTVFIGHVTFGVPYVILNVLPRLRTLNKNAYEAALDLGATPLYAFFKVCWPELMPGIMSGFLMAATMSMDDFVITYFTRGPGINTISTMVYSEVKRGIQPEMYALSTLLFLLILVLLLLFNFLSGRKNSMEV